MGPRLGPHVGAHLLVVSCETATAAAPPMPESMPREPCRPRIGRRAGNRRQYPLETKQDQLSRPNVWPGSTQSPREQFHVDLAKHAPREQVLQLMLVSSATRARPSLLDPPTGGIAATILANLAGRQAFQAQTCTILSITA